MTRAQARVLEALLFVIAERGYSPTVRDLGEMLGLSVSTVHQHLRGLRENGVVDWHDGRNRTLRVL